MNLTAEEKSCIAALRRLEKRWPKTLWLFAGDGMLYVMRKDESGERRVHANSRVDQGAIVESFPQIEADGGGW